jgi:hypothetical protein
MGVFSGAESERGGGAARRINYESEKEQVLSFARWPERAQHAKEKKRK